MEQSTPTPSQIPSGRMASSPSPEDRARGVTGGTELGGGTRGGRSDGHNMGVCHGEGWRHGEGRRRGCWLVEEPPHLSRNGSSTLYILRKWADISSLLHCCSSSKEQRAQVLPALLLSQLSSGAAFSPGGSVWEAPGGDEPWDPLASTS